MRGFFAHIVPWVIVFVLGFSSGDRYGAPGWMAGIADKGFTPVENIVGNSLGSLLEKVSEPVPTGEEPEEDASTSDEGAEGEDGATSPENEVSDDNIAQAAGIPQNRKLKLNDAALQIIKDSEVLYLEPYSESGLSYIGYGHVMRGDEDFTSINAKNAEKLLRKDVAKIEKGVRSLLTRPASENEFSAMVSLAYSKGLVSFAGSDVLKQFNAGDEIAAADDFRRYIGTNGDAPHLVERRERERMLFLK